MIDKKIEERINGYIKEYNQVSDDLVKTEKGQDVLGEVLADWDRGNGFSTEFRQILLGYKVLLLTKDCSATCEAISQLVNDNGVRHKFIEKDVMRIARAEEIEYVGKKEYERNLPTEEEFSRNRVASGEQSREK